MMASDPFLSCGKSLRSTNHGTVTETQRPGPGNTTIGRMCRFAGGRGLGLPRGPDGLNSRGVTRKIQGRTMQRRDILKAGVASCLLPAGLARPGLAQPAASRVLKFIPESDVAVLDPIVTTAYITRTHAYLIYDTLYGIDADFRPQPQMADGQAVEDGGRRVSICLRPRFEFQDG